MVETFTNVLWLTTAILLVGLWRMRWSKSRPAARADFPSEVIALVCLISLLFPIISMSDDLHPEIVAMEDVVSGKRNLAVVLANIQHVRKMPEVPRIHSSAAILPGTAPLTLLTGFTLVLCWAIPACSSVPATRLGRSPPALA